MTATTRQPTLKQLHAAAQKKWGKRAYVEHSPKAPDAETRAEWRRLNVEAAARLKEIEAELEPLTAQSVLDQMTKAAQFVCDVNGDHPSIDLLRGVLVDAANRAALKSEQADIEQARKSRHPYWYRYKAAKVQSLGGLSMAHILCEADTAAELMEAIAKAK